jgi:hypothetical protein
MGRASEVLDVITLRADAFARALDRYRIDVIVHLG